MHSRMKRTMRTFGRMCMRALVVVGSIAGVVYVSMHPPAFQSYLVPSEELYRHLQKVIKERGSVIVLLEKSSEVVVENWKKFKRSSFTIEIMPSVKLDKWWAGIRESIPAVYEVEPAESLFLAHETILKSTITYKALPVCYVTLSQRVEKKEDEALPEKQKGLLPFSLFKKEPKQEEGVPAVKEQEATEYPEYPDLPVAPPAYPVVPRPVGGVRMAIILDDVGHNRMHEELFFSLPVTITPAILPHLEYSQYFAEESNRRGFDVMLHLPMEASNGSINPGPGLIKETMSDEEIRKLIQENLSSVPGISGINNHMGSKGTASRRLMEIVLTECKRRNYFFIDSYTSLASVGIPTARVVQVPHAKRDVFIDNNNDPAEIRVKVRELMTMAKEKGSAIGIGHYRRNTMQVLHDMLPEFKKEGITLVKVRELVGE